MTAYFVFISSSVRILPGEELIEMNTEFYSIFIANRSVLEAFDMVLSLKSWVWPEISD